MSPDLEQILKLVGAVSSMAMRRTVATEHILSRPPSVAAPVVEQMLALAAGGNGRARMLCEAFASSTIHACAGGDDARLRAIGAAADANGFSLAASVCAVGDPRRRLSPKAHYSDVGVDQDAYFSAVPVMYDYLFEDPEGGGPVVAHRVAYPQPAERYAARGFYFASTQPVSAEQLGARGNPGLMRRLLGVRVLRPRDVVSMAARRPTRPEIAAEIAMADRWFCRPDVREALAMNPFSPLWIVLPILPTLSSALLRRVRDDGAAHERASELARRLLELHAPAPREAQLPEPAPARYAAPRVIRCSRLDITGAALERLREHVLEARDQGRVATGWLRSTSATDVCDECIPIEALGAPCPEEDSEETTWCFDEAMLERAIEESTRASHPIKALYCFEPQDGARAADLPYESSSRTLPILVADVPEPGAVTIRAFQWIVEDDVACWVWTGSLSERETRTTARSSDLVRAIELAPDDHEGYLMYGDYLQARGDARGELVALQHARTVHPDSAELRDREARLLASYPIAGFASRRYRSSDFRWRLGFLESARLSADADRARALLTHPSARFLRTLGIAGEPSSDFFGVLAALAPSTLRTLVVGDRSTPTRGLAGIHQVVPPIRILEVHGACTALSLGPLQLKALKFQGSVAPAVFDELIECPLPELEALYVVVNVDNICALEHLVALLAPDVTPNLRALGVHAPSPAVLDRELAFLLSSRNARRLRRIVVYEPDDATLVRSGQLAHPREELEPAMFGQLARVDPWVRDHVLPSFVGSNAKA